MILLNFQKKINYKIYIMKYSTVILLLLCIYVISILCDKNNFFGGSDETIFVSIPSYRDKDCKETLTNLYKNAKNPELVFVGVLTQNKDESESCKVTNNDTHVIINENVRYLNIDYKEAKGPLYARTIIINKLFKNEKYFLLIDAHTKFAKNWDEKFIDQLKFIKNKGIKKPILSTYPNTTEEYDENENQIHVNHICGVNAGNHYPTVLQAYHKPNGKFYRSFFIGANCMFTFGKFFKEIKLDPSLKHIFNGEEVLISILAYTNGWDIYTPAYNLLVHKYNETMEDKFSWYDDNKDNKDYSKDNDESLEKLKQIMTNPDFSKNYKYGIGNKRTLDSYWKELGFKRSENEFHNKWTLENRNRICNQQHTIDYK